jgi:hypothetical protein
VSKGNPFLAVRLSREQQEALRANASESGLTLSDLVRQVLKEHVEGGGVELNVCDSQSRQPIPTRTTRVRKASRPERLQRVISEAEDLLSEYEDWQNSLPESLQDTATGSALAEAVDNLQQAVDLLTAITPPRGFGRD